MDLENLPFKPIAAPDDTFRVPDLAEVVKGWRCWSLESKTLRYGLKPKLYSVAGTSGYFWVPRRESVAECNRVDKQHPSSDVPHDEASHLCGFYSAKTYKHLKTMPYWKYNEEVDGYFKIVGVVANWGKVIECSLGWRAQKAYPNTLFIPYEAWRLARPLAETYGVPVYLKNFLQAYGKERLGETDDDVAVVAAGNTKGAS
jgi:hypothetical protein